MSNTITGGTFFYRVISLILTLAFVLQPLAFVHGYDPNNQNVYDYNFYQKQITSHDISSAGAFEYVIDLQLPQWQGEFLPPVNLTYSSQDTSDVSKWGYGWSDQIPYIEIRNTTGLNNMYDRYDFYSSIHGNLLLQATGTQAGLGLYVPEMIDTAQWYYDHTSDHEQWKVTAPDGSLYYFGATSTKVLANTNNGKIYRWYVDRVVDPNGNTMTFDYTTDTDTNRYPSNITYGDFELVFHSSSTPAVTKYTYGSALVHDRVIEKIAVNFDGSPLAEHVFEYDTSPDSQRKLLASHTKRGFDGSSWVEQPSTTFDYTESNVSFQVDPNVAHPPVYESFKHGWIDPTTQIWGPWPSYPESISTAFIDNDHNGIPSFFGVPVYGKRDSAFMFEYNPSSNSWEGGSTMVQSPTYNNTCNCYPYTQKGYFLSPGWAWGEVNGDYIADGFSNIYIPSGDNDDFDHPNKWRRVDLNGDDLTDAIAYNRHDSQDQWHILYKRTDGGFDEVIKPGGHFPGQFADYQEYFFTIDWNNDGLGDLVQGPVIYINTGNESFEIHSYPTYYSHISPQDGKATYRVADINGDSLPDVSQALEVTSIVQDQATVTYHSVHEVVGDQTTTIPGTHTRRNPGGHTDPQPVWYVDVDQDGMVDIINGHGGFSIHMNQGTVPDRMQSITTSQGATITPEFKRTTQLYDQNHQLQNPKLYTPLTVVTKVTTDDGLGNVSDTTYNYEGGEFVFKHNNKKRIAGFEVITETNVAADKVTKTYYHQGNGNSTTTQEFGDVYELIGRPFKTETLTASGTQALTTTFNHWAVSTSSNNQAFVYMTDTVERIHGSGTTKDKATSYVYDLTTKAVTEQKDWREAVYYPNTRTIADANTDLLTTTYDYAVGTLETIAIASSSYPVTIYAPAGQQSKNYSHVVVSDSKQYYDGLSYGQLDKGNLTKQAVWLNTDDSWIETSYTYDSYGNVLTETDPRGNTTTYTYDSYDLYPETVENALEQETDYTYDYSSGEVVSVTGPNSKVSQTLYDGLDRKVSEKRTSPSGSLVTVATYSYDDTLMPRKVTETRYHTVTPQTIVSYYDGLGRVVQTKAQTSNGDYSTKTYSYDSAGRLVAETLPYVSSNTSYEASVPVDTPEIATSYDSLDRPLVVVSPTGTSTNVYDRWDVTTTNKNGVAKTSKYDARGNLVEVVEDANGAAYSTTYTYDVLNNLVKIIDAEDNEREFLYDSLGRQTYAELPHKSSAAAATYAYEYDANGNKTKEIYPDGKEVIYTYDALNRLLTKDEPTSSSTEIVYSYDTATSGIGYLASESANHYNKSYGYDLAGNIHKETVTVATSALANLGTTGTSTAIPDAEAYQYKQAITIKGESGAGSNYQVLLKVGAESSATGDDFHLHGNASAFPITRNHGGDLNFYDDDETTMLPFWVEKVENNVAHIWVKVADDLSSDQTIYIYYGQDSPVNYSDGEETFELFDEFDAGIVDTNKWSVVGDVAVVSGQLYVGDTTGDHDWVQSIDTFGTGYQMRWYGTINPETWTNPRDGLLDYTNTTMDGVAFRTRADTASVKTFHTNIEAATSIPKGHTGLWHIQRDSDGTANFYIDEIAQTEAYNHWTGTAAARIHSGDGVDVVDYIFISKFADVEPSFSSTAGEQALAMTHPMYQTLANATGTDVELGEPAELEEVIETIEPIEAVEIDQDLATSSDEQITSTTTEAADTNTDPVVEPQAQPATTTASSSLDKLEISQPATSSSQTQPTAESDETASTSLVLPSSGEAGGEHATSSAQAASSSKLLDQIQADIWVAASSGDVEPITPVVPEYIAPAPKRVKPAKSYRHKELNWKLRGKISEKQARVFELQNKVLKKKQTLANLHARLQKRTDRIAELEDKIAKRAAKGKDTSDQEAKVVELQSKVSNIQDKIERVENKRTELRQRMKNVDTRINKIKKKLESPEPISLMQTMINAVSDWFTIPVAHASTWANTQYDYKLPITIDGASGAGSNYPVLFKIGATSAATNTDFHLYGHAEHFPTEKDDGGDLLFYAADDSTALDFWVEKVDNNVAYVWVEVTDNLDSDQTIYLYYGHSTPINYSDGEDTFELFDEFGGASVDGTKWTITGNATVSAGQLNVGDTAADHDWVQSITTFGTNNQMRWYGTVNTESWTNPRDGLLDYTNSTMDGVAFRTRADTGNVKTYSNDSEATTSIAKGHTGLWHLQRTSTGGANFYIDEVAQTSPSLSYTGTAAARIHSGNGVDVVDYLFVAKYNDTEPVFLSTTGEEAYSSGGSSTSTPPLTGSSTAPLAAGSTTDTTHITTYNYTDYGLLDSIVYPDGNNEQYGYTIAGKIDVILRNGAYVVQDTQYNHNDQIIQRTLANGITEDYSYDASQEYRLTNKTTNDGTDDLQDLAYGFDAVGNITQISDSGTQLPKTVDYAYDELDRLVYATTTVSGSSTVSDYTYSPTGNMLSANGLVYTYGNNQHPQASTGYDGKTYAYDTNGNLVSKIDGATTTAYTYDWADRLVTVTKASSTIAEYAYNAERQRILKTVGTSTTAYINGQVEIDETGQYTTYVFDDSVRIATIDEDGAHWNHQDHLQSSSLTTDYDGNVEQAIDYLPFGTERVNIKNGEFDSSYTFTDQEKDNETGLMYYDARYYDPELRRFTSVDPWGGNYANPQTLNKYSYTLNNPIKYEDPTGETPVLAIAAGVGVVGGLVGVASLYATSYALGTQDQITVADVAGAFGGGFVAGLAATVAAPATVVGTIGIGGAIGSASGLTANTITQTINVTQNEDIDYSLNSAVRSTVVGGVTGVAGATVGLGLTSNTVAQQNFVAAFANTAAQKGLLPASSVPGAVAAYSTAVSTNAVIDTGVQISSGAIYHGAVDEQEQVEKDDDD